MHENSSQWNIGTTIAALRACGVKLVAHKCRCQMPFHVSRSIETAAIFCGMSKFRSIFNLFQVKSSKFLSKSNHSVKINVEQLEFR